MQIEYSMASIFPQMSVNLALVYCAGFYDDELPNVSIPVLIHDILWVNCARDGLGNLENLAWDLKAAFSALTLLVLFWYFRR